MSILQTPDSLPSPTNSDKSIEAQLQPQQNSDLYLSLEAALKHPSCVSETWMETIGDFKNNPRSLPYAPYNDGALYYVDDKQKPLSMAFPAVIDLNGKFSKIGPYFNLMGDQNVKVRYKYYISFCNKINLIFIATDYRIVEQNESHFRAFTSHCSIGT
jgi:hypothetical protein